MSKPTRLIYRNLAKLTSVAASSTAAGYPASNLLTTDKAETWRAAGKTATLSGSSATLLTASSFHLLGNFSPTAQARVSLFSDQAATVPVRVTAYANACPEPSAELDGWTPTQAASAYAHGGGAWARQWIPETAFRAWSVEVNDPGNLQGALEAAFLVIGNGWSPTYDIEEAEIALRDTSTKTRSAAGSLKVRKGIRYGTMDFDLSDLTKVDHREALRMFRYCGTSVPILAVVHPDDPDAELEGATTLYGMLDEVSALVLQGPDSFATKISLESL